MLLFANHYYNFGFNITHISSQRKKRHRIDEDILKSPSHDWAMYINRRQSISELHSFDWQNASGLGVVLGYDNLRALDIDECNNLNVLKSILNVLGLPENYQWVVRSGSNNGFHIIFYCDQHRYPTAPGKVKAFKPNSNNFDLFKHVELRWIGHLVAPPSKHLSMHRYEFLNIDYPTIKPNSISLEKVELFVKSFCSNNGAYIINSSDVQVPVSDDYIDIEAEIFKVIIDHDLMKNDTSGVYIDEEENSLDYPTVGIGGNITASIFDDPIDISGVYIDEDPESIGKPYHFFFDTETTGKPIDWNAPVTNISNWPRLVQIAYIVYDKNGNELSANQFIIKPNGYLIPQESVKIHGITNEKANEHGVTLSSVLNILYDQISKVNCLVAHNINFDEKVLGAEFLRNNMDNILSEKTKICTMELSTDFCAISGYNGYKWPKLSELYYKLFEHQYDNAHNAYSDIRATAKCYWELKKQGII